MGEVAKTYNDKVDQFEKVLVDALSTGAAVPVELRWTHIFTPGLYTRQIFMPKGSIVTSEIHKTEHPFIVSQGVVAVLTEEGEQIIQGPYIGVTKPSTRRVLFVHEDCIWTTCHRTDKTTVEEVAEEILEQHTNYLINNGNRKYGQGNELYFNHPKTEIE